MKKFLSCLLFLALTVSAAAKTFPLNEESKQEEKLYLSFIEALLAEQAGQDACPYYQKTLALAPQSKYLRRILTVCAIVQEDLAAADEYATYINEGENDGKDWAVYAFYNWRKGQLKEAQQYYEKSLETDPEDLRVLYQYVLLLTYIDPDRAAEKLQQQKANYPSIAHVIDYEIGNIYYRKKQIQKALEFYNLATQQDPEYAEPYLARAEIYEKSNQFFLMLRELELLEKTGYESAVMYSRMGSLYVIVKDDERAQTYFAKAKKLDNGDTVAGYFLALYAEEKGDYAAAAQYLRETADYDTSAAKWLQVAFYQQAGGSIEQAADTLAQAYKRFADNVEISYFYALALHDTGRYKQAAKVLKGVLKTNPSYEQARLAYAFVLEAQKKYKEMEKQLRLVLVQNDKNASAYNLLGFSLAERNERLDEAEQLAAKAVQLQPQDRAFIDSLAWVYYRQGKYAQALDLLKNLDENFVNANADVAYHLGAVYAALGQYDTARPYLQQAAGSVKEAAELLKKLPAGQN